MMSGPGGNEKGLSQNGDPGGHLSVLTSAHSAAVGPETRLLSAFRKDTHHRKVYLAGRGESARLRSSVTVQKTLEGTGFTYSRRLL